MPERTYPTRTRAGQRGSSGYNEPPRRTYPQGSTPRRETPRPSGKGNAAASFFHTIGRWFGAFGRWFGGQYRRKPRPVWMLVALDLLLTIIALLVFALFHHVMPRQEKAVGIQSSRYGTVQTSATQAPAVYTAADIVTEEAVPSGDTESVDETASSAVIVPEATIEPAATPDPVGYFGTKFADKYTSGNVISSANSYQSANLNISYTEVDQEKLVYYVLDFYVRDISCLQTAMANSTFGTGNRADITAMSSVLNAVCAINGDQYSARTDGNVIRNGVLYREDSFPTRDVCVLYWDGTMKIFPKGNAFWPAAEMSNGAYQAWTFGPSLLNDDGSVPASIDSEIAGNNPRSAIGYFEPGHYCFVVVDGRSDDSKGISLMGLSQIMHDLGCKVAYNLDGGATSQLVINNSVVNNPTNGGRDCSDIIALIDAVKE